METAKLFVQLLVCVMVVHANACPNACQWCQVGETCINNCLGIGTCPSTCVQCGCHSSYGTCALHDPSNNHTYEAICVCIEGYTGQYCDEPIPLPNPCGGSVECCGDMGNCWCDCECSYFGDCCPGCTCSQCQ